jgi:hypothetical protein
MSDGRRKLRGLYGMEGGLRCLLAAALCRGLSGTGLQQQEHFHLKEVRLCTGMVGLPNTPERSSGRTCSTKLCRSAGALEFRRCHVGVMRIVKHDGTSHQYERHRVDPVSRQ